jgi:hypothetical protein
MVILERVWKVNVDLGIQSQSPPELGDLGGLCLPRITNVVN